MAPAATSSTVKESLAPVLRVGNTAHAAEWYQRLGFTLQFEHSTGPNLNRTDATLTRGDLRLILAEGDEEVSPEATVCLVVREVDSIAQEFEAEIQHSFLREQVNLSDPYGNRVRVVAIHRLPPAPRP